MGRTFTFSQVEKMYGEIDWVDIINISNLMANLKTKFERN